MRPVLATAALLGVLAIGAPAAGAASESAAQQAVTAHRVLVGVRPGGDLARVVRRLRPLGTVGTVRAIRLVTVETGRLAAVRARLRGLGDAAFVERDGVLRTEAEPADAIDPATGFAFDWAYAAVHAGEALAALTGTALTAPVAIVDSGIDATHPDLAGRIAASYDVLTGGRGAPTDTSGHGTFIAGLVSAVDGNGIGTKGVAGATPLLVARAGFGDEISISGAARGITWAVDHDAKVINLSFGGSTSTPQALELALGYAASKDVLVVASAGNDGETTNARSSPAIDVSAENGAWSTGLAVAATRPDGQRAAFSTANSFVSVAAPGAAELDACPAAGVYSTVPIGAQTIWDVEPCLDPTGPPGTTGGRWGYAEGTSFASPIVAGIAALVRDAAPRLKAPQVADVIRRSAHQTLGTGWNEQTGTGMADALAAVTLARTYDTASPLLTTTAAPVVRAVRVRLSATDRAGAGQTLARGLTYSAEVSSNGRTFRAVNGTWRGGVARTLTLDPKIRVWLRLSACDANHNCARQTRGPLRPRAATRPR